MNQLGYNRKTLNEVSRYAELAFCLASNSTMEPKGTKKATRTTSLQQETRKNSPCAKIGTPESIP